MAIDTKQLPTSPGIYCIRNTVNGKIYIGSSRDVQKRVRKHRNTLASKIHGSTYLQNAWNKYGPEVFEVTMIASVFNPDDLRDVEQQVLDQSQSYKKEIGYNLSPIAHRCEHNEDSKLKLRLANLGKTYSEEACRRRARFGSENHFHGRSHSFDSKMQIALKRGGVCKPFRCIETGEVYNFHAEASRSTGANSGSISECLRKVGYRKTAGGYHWEYIDP